MNNEVKRRCDLISLLTSVGEKESPTDEVITSIMYSLKSHYIFRNSVQVGISEFLY